MTPEPAPNTEGSLAVDEAARVLERISADELAADAMRDAIRHAGLPHHTESPADEPMDGREHVVAVRQATRIASDRADDDADSADRTGRLYLTTRRLLLVGRCPLTVKLDDIDELSVVGERLLVALRDGGGLSLEVDRPRELRVLIAGALAVVRG